MEEKRKGKLVRVHIQCPMPQKMSICEARAPKESRELHASSQSASGKSKHFLPTTSSHKYGRLLCGSYPLNLKIELTLDTLRPDRELIDLAEVLLLHADISLGRRVATGRATIMLLTRRHASLWILRVTAASEV